MRHELLLYDLDVRNPRRQHRDGEEGERDETLPDVYHTRRDKSQYDVEPDVGENRPSGRDEEHIKVLLPSDLRRRDSAHANGDDHEEIESSGAHNGVGACN